jgi:alpha-beta hydrolase superfamily lysophospholipase
MGHSMGAAGVGWYLATRTPHPAIAAAMFSAAPLSIPKTPAMKAKELLGRVLARIAPTLTLGNELDPSGISSVPAEVERYRKDPWVHDRISVRLGLALLRQAPKLAERARAITMPALLWHGAADPLVDARGSRLLHDGLGSADKQLHLVEGARHEVHHDAPERVARLFELVRGWLRPRILR